MIPSRVLSTTTCTFILLLVLNVDVAGTVTPTPGSYSTNIDYATTSPDKNCIDAVDPRFTMEYTFDEYSFSVTSCVMNALAALSEFGQSRFCEMHGTDTQMYGYPTVSIVTNGTPKCRHDRNAFYHLEYLGGSPINHSEKHISESTSNAVMEGSDGGLYYIRPIWFPAGYSGE